MASLYSIMEQVVADKKITEQEVAVIQQYIRQNGRLDLEDVRFLVQLLVDSREVCPAFDRLFFPILKEVLLADGRIQNDELFYLFKMVYGDGRVRNSEREFLLELRRECRETTAEFDAFCDQVLATPDSGWSLGGRAGAVAGSKG